MSCTSLEKAEFMLNLEWGGGLHGQGWCSDTGVGSGASSGAGNRPVKIRKDVLIQSNYILAMQGNYNCTRRKVSDKAIITGCLFSGCPCPQNRAESANTVVHICAASRRARGRSSLRRGQKTKMCDVQL